MKGSSEAQFYFSFVPQFIAQPDGAVLVKPGKPAREVTPRQAALMLGISRSSIYELIQTGHLSHRRPLPKKILIPVESLEEHRRKTDDPEFWDNR